MNKSNPQQNLQDNRVSLNIAVLTISDSRTRKEDAAGDYLSQAISSSGHTVSHREIIPNHVWHIRKAFCDLVLNAQINVIIINGGTGFTHNKATIPAIEPMLDNEIIGFGELFRQLSYQDIGSSSLQSAALAGLADNKLVFCIPGSPNACKLAWEKILQSQFDSKQMPCNFATMYG